VIDFEMLLFTVMLPPVLERGSLILVPLYVMTDYKGGRAAATYGPVRKLP
jgi:hypothetical protein